MTLILTVMEDRHNGWGVLHPEFDSLGGGGEIAVAVKRKRAGSLLRRFETTTSIQFSSDSQLFLRRFMILSSLVLFNANAASILFIFYLFK